MIPVGIAASVGVVKTCAMVFTGIAKVGYVANLSWQAHKLIHAPKGIDTRHENIQTAQATVKIASAAARSLEMIAVVFVPVEVNMAITTTATVIDLANILICRLTKEDPSSLEDLAIVIRVAQCVFFVSSNLFCPEMMKSKVWELPCSVAYVVYEYLAGDQAASIKKKLKLFSTINYLLHPQVISFDHLQNIQLLTKNPFPVSIWGTSQLCCISKLPLRYVFVVKGTENSPHPVCYEESEITQWMDTHAGESPPGWPENIAYERSNATAFTQEQIKVDVHIESLISSLLELDHTHSIEDLHFNPFYFLWGDTKYRCSINDTPLRFACLLKGTSKQPVFFERETIKKHFRESTTRPRHWPQDIKYCMENVEHCAEAQKEIDARLNYLLMILKEKDPFKRLRIEITQAKSINDLQWVPSFIDIEENQPPLICPIEKRPIRFVIGVAHPNNKYTFYEKSALTRWIQSDCTMPPNEWPKGVDYLEQRSDPHKSKQLLFQASEVQQIIDNWLSRSYETHQLIFKLQITDSKSAALFLKLHAITNPLSKKPIPDLSTPICIDSFSFNPFSQPLWGKDFVCPIHQHPIRHVVVVRGTESSAHPIYFEKTAIEHWIRNHQTPPSCWPDGIKYSQENIEGSTLAQEKINQRLTFLFELVTSDHLSAATSMTNQDTLNAWLSNFSLKMKKVFTLKIPNKDMATLFMRLYDLKNPLNETSIIGLETSASIDQFSFNPFSRYLWGHDLICNLHQHPLRFASVVKGTENSMHPIYYEKAAIEDWMMKKQAPPPSWPQDVLYSKDNIISCAAAQNKIIQKFAFILKILSTTDIYNKSVTEVLEHATMESLPWIPNFIAQEAIQYPYRCATSQRPIRFICALRVDSDPQVYFEKSNIMHWIALYPCKRPKSWPDQVPYDPSLLIHCPDLQKEIDDELNALLVGFQQTLRSLEMMDS